MDRLELRRILQLHALTGIPNSPFVGTWGIYTEICVWVVLFSACSGVYLWATLKRDLEPDGEHRRAIG